MPFKVPKRKKLKVEHVNEEIGPRRSSTKAGCRNASVSCANQQNQVVHLKHLRVIGSSNWGATGLLPSEKRVTRGSVLRSWQEGNDKPWSDLPGLRLRFAESCTTTSDYGTASEDSHNCSSANGFSPQEACRCECMSGVGCLSTTSEDEGLGNSPPEPCASTMENCAWGSDSENEDCLSTWDDSYKGLRLLRLAESQITAIVPFQSPAPDLCIRVLNDAMYKPKCGIRVHHVSHVVSVEPHGLQFRSDFPAFLSIPVNTDDERNLVCLCSNTSEHELPKWERMPSSNYKYRDGFLVLTINHFSLFTVLLEEPYPESLKRVRRRVGGTLRVDEVPGVEVYFPRGCLQDDIDAYLRVLYDSEPATIKSDLLSSKALASPIIMIGPHGHQFDPKKPAVAVSLPVPDMKRICERFQIPINEVVSSLSIYQSPTMESEQTVWERLNTELTVNINHPSGVPVVSFEVHHFSFFTVVWDLLSASLYEAKLGLAYYYPYITFSMMCEAFMQETPNTNRFGLEVIFYRSDRRLPETTNLQHRVGSSIKPKFVRPGCLLIRLKSQMFEADEDAGEDKDMAKEEPDFRGRDFEKQFACRFKKSIEKDLGAFGKVLVEMRKGPGKNDLILDFNVYKTGHESEANTSEGSERWSTVVIKELAATLHLIEDDNWKKFAQQIGFTKKEIKSKLQLVPDPFTAMMTLYNQRGGTPEEFVDTLYTVSREIQVNKGRNTPPSSSHGSVSPSHSGSSSFQQTTPNRRFPWPWKLQHSPPQQTDSEMPAPQSKRIGQKRSHPSSGKNSSGKLSKSKMRRKQSEKRDTDSTTTEPENEESEDNIDCTSGISSSLNRNNPRKLDDSDMWKLSSHMSSINWRALGRTLGVEESVLLNVEHNYKIAGVRECSYQTLLEWKGHKPKKCTLGVLYTSLCNEKMNAIAKQVIQHKFDEAG